MEINEFLTHFQRVTQKGKEHSAQCPAHEDDTNSLSISNGNKGIVLHCHAGCEPTSILTALKLSLSDLFPPAVNTQALNPAKSKIIATYPYHAANGTLLYQVVRFDPKDFRQRRPDPDNEGGWVWNTKDTLKVLYHLPKVLAAKEKGETIYLVEGERDADALISLGLVATTNTGGAGKWPKSGTATLAGCNVVILPDNDEPGRKHAEVVAGKLAQKARRLKIFNLPDLPEKGDVSDWIRQGGTREKLEELCARQTQAGGADIPLPYSDYTNACALVRDHGRDLRYCWPWKKWLRWTGSYWRADETGAVRQKAKQVIKRLAGNAEHLEDDSAVKALMKHVKTSLSMAATKAMIESAQDETDIPILPEDLDTNPWLLNCANGTLDLQTGLLRPHDRSDLLTRLIHTAYDPGATCPTWEIFLWRIMGGTMIPDDQDTSTDELMARERADIRARALIDFLQKAIGYSLTGDISEQCLFVFHGEGANGKSTLLELLQALLGDYAQSTPSASLLAKEHHEDIPNDIARLRGARLVTAVEIGEGKRLNEELIKRLTGGDTITARFLHAEFFDFKPVFKLFIACNHLPAIRGTDRAIWRRVRLIPFTVTIPDDEQDKDLAAKLNAELPGILAWAVRGCLAWRRDGLGTPDVVRAATQDYRASQDVIGRFIDERCLRNSQVRVKASTLYDAYKKWCEAGGEYAVSSRELGIKLSERGLEPHRGTGGTRWRVGIGLLEISESDTSDT
jgi:putative DNA primase/helicase